MTRRCVLPTLVVMFASAMAFGQPADPLAGRATPDIPVVSMNGEPSVLDMGERDTVVYVIAPRTPACAENVEAITALWQAKRGRYRFVAVSLRRDGLNDDPASRQLPFDVVAFEDHRDPALQSYAFGAFPALYVTSARTRTIRRAWGGVLSGRTLKDVERFFDVRLPESRR